MLRHLTLLSAPHKPLCIAQDTYVAHPNHSARHKLIAPFSIGDAGPDISPNYKTGSSACRVSIGSTCSCLAFTASRSLISPLEGLSAMLLLDGTRVNQDEIARAPSSSSTVVNNTLPTGSAVLQEMSTSPRPSFST